MLLAYIVYIFTSSVTNMCTWNFLLRLLNFHINNISRYRFLLKLFLNLHVKGQFVSFVVFVALIKLKPMVIGLIVTRLPRFRFDNTEIHFDRIITGL